MSTTISASLVKELRDLTGAGMMDCKRALEETAGDLDAARKLLRERGMAQAGKRAGRETTEGRVLVRTEAGVGAIVAVGCETEPVSNNEAFRAFAERVLDSLFADGEGAAERLEAERVELVAKLGENIVVRTERRLEAIGGEDLASYVHAPAHKIGVLLRYRGDDAEAARRIAMHVASEAPGWLRRDDVPEETVAAEREIYRNSDEVQSKPEQAREKIVEGMLGKRFFAAKGGALLDQAFIHDTGRTVAQAAQEAGIEVVDFVRASVTE
ncbi:MAG TPA: translation elongation factor Ts [Gaiellaceae bacterium]|nr:translation elongation factor Ts [Gaiellaceae bacterium]